MWRNCESGCLCFSVRWRLVSSAHSQPSLSFIANVLCKRRSGHTWYNKDKKREGQCPVKRSHKWSITVNTVTIRIQLGSLQVTYYSIDFCLILEKSCRIFRVDISQGSCQVLLRIILNFDQVPDKIFYWAEEAGSYPDSLSNLFRILKRKTEKIRSRLYQILASICSGFCSISYLLILNQFSWIFPRSCTELYKNK